MSDEQAACDLKAIRGMWELAAVYEFMGQFKFWLNFSQLYPLHDLEDALVRSPGPGGEGRPKPSADSRQRAHHVHGSCCAAPLLPALSGVKQRQVNVMMWVILSSASHCHVL